ncbi:protein kinase [Streptomyces sp. NPDC059605]|uniref:protein kinase domain-containing protein n=1 Tax=unclassified Streptomyces TaxID=2593676 RepID=UPI003688FC41
MTERPGDLYAVSVPDSYRVGDWIVGAPLGAGGFGSVYAARRAGAGSPRTAALKFLPTGTHTPRQLRHLRDLAEREVELLSRVRAPRLVRMHEVLTVDDPGRQDLDGATVLVLDRAESSLDVVLRAPAPPASGPRLLFQICEGLQQLHEAGWVHGDLKPANVLLQDGEARLADFNMAAEMEGTHAYAPAFATPDYTPPELLWGQVGERGQLVRPTADIWAFGVLAHLVLTGTLPLPGGTRAARRDAVVRYARGTEPLRLSSALPPGWRGIITDCLATTHEERAPHDAATLLGRIRSVLDGAHGSPAGPPPRPGRRLRRSLIALACAGALTAFGLYLGTRPTEGDGSRTVRSAGTDAPARTTGPTAGHATGPATEPVGYDRCIRGSVCFFTAADGGGRMCAWEGDETDWLEGENRCSWAGRQHPRSVFNNGRAATEGESYAQVVYYADKYLKNRLGCLSAGTRTNLSVPAGPRSHVWAKRC